MREGAQKNILLFRGRAVFRIIMVMAHFLFGLYFRSNVTSAW